MERIIKRRTKLRNFASRFASAFESREARASGRVPLLFARREGCFLPHLTPAARLVRPDASVGAVLALLRREMKLRPHQAIFVFLPCYRLAPASATVGQLHAQNPSGDGLLRLIYSSEDAFGGAGVA